MFQNLTERAQGFYDATLYAEMTGVQRIAATFQYVKSEVGKWWGTSVEDAHKITAEAVGLSVEALLDTLEYAEEVGYL